MFKDGNIKERLKVEEFEKIKILLNDLDMSYGDVKNFSGIGVNAIILSTTLQKFGFTGIFLDQVLIVTLKK